MTNAAPKIGSGYVASACLVRIPMHTSYIKKILSNPHTDLFITQYF